MDRIAADWLNTPHTQAVCAALTKAGYQALFVGGCVRNALLGAPVSDIDIATDARPEQVTQLAQDAGLKPIPTGIEHGTITVVADHMPHEVTTFRRDVETDGRRAVVAFADNIEDDAHRRDFTMNALYARPDGAVLDPLCGLPDLRARRVRFIDDAEARIREDYLRILRFFRFHAWYGDAAQGLEPEGLAACAALSAGIETLSKERIGAEVLKLLAAPNPAPSVAAMEQAGVLLRVLPGASAKALPILVHLEGEAPPDPIARLAGLGGEEVAAQLRLSRAQAKRVQILREAAVSGQSPAALGYGLGSEDALAACRLGAALLEQPLPEDLNTQVKLGAQAQFPLRAADLMPNYAGPDLGKKLKALEQRWIASGFQLSREELLR